MGEALWASRNICPPAKSRCPPAPNLNETPDCRGKTKVSYYMTFFQTLLKTFSCGLCHSYGRIILSYCEKRKVNYDVCKNNKRASTLYFQRTTKVSCYKYLHCRGKTKVSYYILLREKQKYHITSRSSKLS